MPQSNMWESAGVEVGYPTEHFCRLAKGEDPGEQLRDPNGQHAADYGRDT